MNYWQLSRSPRYAVLFALPLLVGYESLAFVLDGGATAGVRNGADVLLKALFLSLGGTRGLLVFDLLLLGVGGYLVWRDRGVGGALQRWVFAGMLAEAVLLAVAFGIVAGFLTAVLLRGPSVLAIGGLGQFGLGTQVMLSLGAGIYEELLFRVILVTALVALARVGFGWKDGGARAFGVIIGALIFSAFHYVGPYGDPWTLQTFTFRFVSGLLFSGLFVLRGFGVTAWTHALYDVFLAVAGIA
jgi:membrane protease YdiL (CAAX protease family)